MRKHATFIVMLLFLGIAAFAQNRTVKGTVKNEKGEPVPFATVTEAGTKNATTADEGGNFSISIKPNGKLTISATGFGANTITPGSGDVMAVINSSQE